MKRLLLSGFMLPMLAACSTISLDTVPELRPDEVVVDIASQPLMVPALDALPDTAPRALAGKFVPVTYGALPGWANDDMQSVWKAFINNCKGLMRPVAGAYHAGALRPGCGSPYVRPRNSRVGCTSRHGQRAPFY